MNNRTPLLLAAVLVSLALAAPAPAAKPDPSEGGRNLTKAHTAHVAAGIERLLATGRLSAAHELTTREGLAAFLAARAGGQRPAQIDPEVPEALWSLERDPGLDEVMAQPTAGKKGLTPHPSGVNSVGAVVCTIGDELLVNGRFVLFVDFQGFVGGVEIARSCRMTNSAGYFFFFDRNNVEIPVKMLNACFGGSPPGHWVFAAGLTNFAVEISVFDLFTGLVKSYFNPLGNTFNTIIDQGTPFPCP